MKTVVVRNIRRAEPDIVKRLGALGVATAHEAYGRFGLRSPICARCGAELRPPAPP
jgi:4-hydroxy-4-methyl-2-oxoglutarate aldolase